MVEIESVVLKLGEREYTVKQAAYLRSKPWKKRLFDEIQPLFARMGGAAETDFRTMADLMQLLPLAQDLFLDGIDTIYCLLLAYSPDLEADREYIEANASDKQILVGFQEVVKLSDPFGVVAMMTRRNGLYTNGTS